MNQQIEAVVHGIAVTLTSPTLLSGSFVLTITKQNTKE